MIFLASIGVDNVEGRKTKEIEAENTELALRTLEAMIMSGEADEVTLFAPVTRMTAQRTISREQVTACNPLKKS